MARFLTPEWLAELDAAVRSDASVGTVAGDTRIVVEQRVTGAGAGGPDFVYHVVLDHGKASVVAGPAADPTVTFTQDAATARRIATGEESAQRAFMAGNLRVGGNLQSLAEHQAVLSKLNDVFAGVRAATDFGPHEG